MVEEQKLIFELFGRINIDLWTWWLPAWQTLVARLPGTYIHENCQPRLHDMQACHKMGSQECRQHLSPIVLSLGGNIIVALIRSLVTARTSPGKYCNWFDMSVRLFRGLIGGKNNSLITTMMLLTFPCWRRRTWRSWTCRQRRPTHQTALRIIVWR